MFNHTIPFLDKRGTHLAKERFLRKLLKVQEIVSQTCKMLIIIQCYDWRKLGISVWKGGLQGTRQGARLRRSFSPDAAARHSKFWPSGTLFFLCFRAHGSESQEKSAVYRVCARRKCRKPPAKHRFLKNRRNNAQMPWKINDFSGFSGVFCALTSARQKAQICCDSN